jgi:predicted Zn-dependent peptidase
LTIVGPRGPEDLAEGLAYLDGLGGELTPLECSIEGDSELYEAQIIVVDHPGSQALLRSIQPLGPGEDAAQRQVLWALMEGYSSRVGTAVRSESGLSYASWARLVEIPGMRFAELELGVELERAVEALLLVEEVLQRSIEEGLGPEEMEMARLQVQQSRLRQAMEPWDVVAWASWSQHLDTPLDVLEEQWSPPVLTSARVNSALKEIGSTDRRTWVIVGSVDTIAPALERAGLTIDQLWESENLWQEPEGSTK